MGEHRARNGCDAGEAGLDDVCPLRHLPQVGAAYLAPAESIPAISPGERAFEIVLARRIAARGESTTWFSHHGSTPITEIPERWPAAYRDVVARRVEAIESSDDLGLLERPEFKRRWLSDGWESMETAALRQWLLDRCEAQHLWYEDRDGIYRPRPLTIGRLARLVLIDPRIASVATLLAPDRAPAEVITDLLAEEHIQGEAIVGVEKEAPASSCVPTHRHPSPSTATHLMKRQRSLMS